MLLVFMLEQSRYVSINIEKFLAFWIVDLADLVDLDDLVDMFDMVDLVGNLR